MLALDPGVLYRTAHVVRTREALAWTGARVALALTRPALRGASRAEPVARAQTPPGRRRRCIPAGRVGHHLDQPRVRDDVAEFRADALQQLLARDVIGAAAARAARAAHIAAAGFRGHPLHLVAQVPAGAAEGAPGPVHHAVELV